MRQWYIAKTTYCRELTLKRFFEHRKMKCYVPMRYVEQIGYNGRKRRIPIPAIHNIVFLHTEKQKLNIAIEECPIPLYYQKKPGSSELAIVPKKQMEDFLLVANHKTDTKIMDLSELSLTQGDKVRITHGTFTGIEGEYVKIGGQHRVMVLLYGPVAAATAHIPFQFVEKIG